MEHQVPVLCVLPGASIGSLPDLCRDGNRADCGGVGEKERKRVSMEISKETRKRMMQIIAFGILLYCGMEHFDVVIGAVDFVLGIVMPFLVGGAIAFVINVPMKSIERHLFVK